MAQPAYPPPPPPKPSSVKTGVHGPSTNFFGSVRARLPAFEGQSQLAERPKRGLLIALILGATVSIALSVVVQLVLGVGGAGLLVVVAPLTEEPFKALSMVIVALFVWKMIPNRRYGAALGAAAGLGFGIAESLLYVVGFLGSNAPPDQILLAILVRIVVTPFMHPLWSSFVGIGIFIMIAKNPADRSSPLWLAPLFLFMGLVGHMIWNGFVAGLADFGYSAIVLDIIITLPFLAIILRDFLGGHFNFQNFFEPLPERPPSYPVILPPPPPPPPT